jgi:transcriptional regulator with XRE-family HTH domain
VTPVWGRTAGPGPGNRPIRDAAEPFGAELRAMREARRLSQAELARRAGVDHWFISRLESGSRKPSREMVAVLAEALDLERALRQRLFVAAGYYPPTETE